MASSRASVSLLILALLYAGCERSPYTSPAAATTAPTAGRAITAEASAAVLADFRTRPRDEDGVIASGGPLAVQFNMCRSRAVDPADELKFTYDWEADGAVDEIGSCRARHLFEASASARVCVSARTPDSAVCRTYRIEIAGQGDPPVPEHVLSLAVNGCGAVGSRYLYLQARIEPPVPAGVSYSVSVTIDGEIGAAPFRETVATVSDFDCDDHSPRQPDSSPLPNHHVATMANPRCPHARPFVFTSIEGAPPIADRLQTTVTGFQVSGRRARIEGQTTFICP